MDEKKVKSFHPFGFLKRRKFRIGGYAFLATLLAVAVIVLVNIGATAVEDRWALRLDLTYNSLTKFSEQTKAVLQELDQDVSFYVLAVQGGENPMVTEILDRYSAANRRVTAQVVDPDRNPGLVNAFRASPDTTFASNTVIVSNADKSRFKVYTNYDLIDYGYNEQYQQYYVRSYKYEQMFTQAILFVTAARTPTVFALQGHGEVAFSELAAMRALLTSNNYDVKELSLTDELTAGNGDALFVLSPQRDLTEDERDRFMAYLQDGGNMVYVCDAFAKNDLPNFRSLLDYYGVGFEEGMVFADPGDGSQYYPFQPAMLLPKMNDHEITAPLIKANRHSIIIPQTRSIKLPDMDRSEFAVTELLSSKPGSYRIDLTDTERATPAKQAGDADGPFPLAVSVERKNYLEPEKESRVVLFGSTPAIADLQMLSSFFNDELLVSTVKWVTKDEAVNLSIMSKTAQRAGLRIPSASVLNALGALTVFVIPLAVLAMGVVVWLRRRHL